MLLQKVNKFVFGGKKLEMFASTWAVKTAAATKKIKKNKFSKDFFWHLCSRSKQTIEAYEETVDRCRAFCAVRKPTSHDILVLLSGDKLHKISVWTVKRTNSPFTELSYLHLMRSAKGKRNVHFS
uniref:Uncharacterized protein n=1 Tax=Anguilla anguilla TaxID=7936 RepID=A0A0E9XHW4_ANGAN